MNEMTDYRSLWDTIVRRRITVVAVARRLLIALWRYLETGLVPEGAALKV